MPSKSSTHYTFDPVNFAQDTFLIVRFNGHEEVSQPFHYHFYLISEDPDLPLGEVVNSPVSITLDRNEESYQRHGYVSRFVASRRIQNYYVYEADVVPRLWKLGLSFKQHIYQNQSVPEIIDEVLTRNELGVTDFEFRLEGYYPAREYCTQYKETDLAFIQRLMEYEGIFYFFEHEGHEKLVMTDHMGALPDIGGTPDVTFNPTSGMVEMEEIAESVHGLIAQEEAVTGKVRIRDWNYRTEVFPDGTSEINPDMPGEFYDYGTHIKNQGRARHIAQIRNEEFECARKKIVGKSDVTGFGVGHCFSLADHFRNSLNIDYFLTRVDVAGDQRTRWDLDDFDDYEEIEYRNTFVAVPAAVAYRPPRVTPKPRVPGILTAHVESGSDDYSHIDDEGRYKIKMPFDLRGEQETQHSKTVRLAQPYTSKQGGQHWHLEKQTEVVLACIDGDPDRIMAIGAAPKPSKSSPVNAENHSQHELRTTSQNTLWMEDMRGNEGIKLWSPTKRTGIQLGYRNHQPIDGASIWTEGTGYFEANSGIVIKGGGSQFDAAPELEMLQSSLDSVQQATQSVEASVNQARQDSPVDFSSLTNRTQLGIDDEGGIFNEPGITFLARQGGVLFGTEGRFSVVADEGIHVASMQDVDLVGVDGVNILSEQGIAIINDSNGIDILSADGGVRVHAENTGDIDVYARSGDIIVEAENGNIERTASANIVSNSGENTEFQVGSSWIGEVEGQTNIHTIDEMTLSADLQANLLSENRVIAEATEGDIYVAGRTRAKMVVANSSFIDIRPESITISCGASSITLNQSGNISVEGMRVCIEGSGSVEIEGGGQVQISSGGIFRTNSALTTIN